MILYDCNEARKGLESTILWDVLKDVDREWVIELLCIHQVSTTTIIEMPSEGYGI